MRRTKNSQIKLAMKPATCPASFVDQSIVSLVAPNAPSMPPVTPPAIPPNTKPNMTAPTVIRQAISHQIRATRGHVSGNSCIAPSPHSAAPKPLAYRASASKSTKSVRHRTDLVSGQRPNYSGLSSPCCTGKQVQPECSCRNDDVMVGQKSVKHVF